jgi:hypothetical protein
LKKKGTRTVQQHESIEQHTTITNGGMLMRKRRISVKSKNKVKSSRNITLMVMFQCVLYTFGKLFYIYNSFYAKLKL